MTRALLTLNGTAAREQAARWVAKVPDGTRLEFRAPKRSPAQNDLMWARLSDVSKQVEWHGQKLEPADWKDMFTASLRRARIVPNIDGDGFVQLGLHTSDLSKEEMGNLLDLIDAFGAQRGVTFTDNPDSSEPSPQVEAQSDAPAAQASPLPAAGQQSESSEPASPGADESGDGVSDDAPPSLPQGTLILYAAALRRAQKKDSLAKYAKQFWDQHQGWEKWQDTPDGATAAAIFNVFRDHFGNRDVIELQLRELI